MAGLGLVALATIVGEFVPPFVREGHIVLLYVLAVLVTAVQFGLWLSLLTAVTSVAALDFFFIPPFYSFTIESPADALFLAFFGVVAITMSRLASRLREQMLVARQNADTTNELYLFATELAATVTIDAITSAAGMQVRKVLGYRAAIAVGNEPAAISGLTLPLHAAGKTVGTMTVAADSSVIPASDRRLLGALAELTGVAIGRQLLADQIARLGIEQEAERLRSALLSSIAHDLTAPISSVATALTMLGSGYAALDDTTRREIIADAASEADRLHRFFANLVQLTRLDAGTIELRREPVDIDEIVGSALSRARALLDGRHVTVAIPHALPPLWVDPVLVEQALFNLLENAAKYTPSDAALTIGAEPAQGGVTLSIADTGPGIHPENLERVFTKFYRADVTAGIPGTGLGLTIARGLVEANGGTITAANRPGGGAAFRLFLPTSRAAA